MNGLTANRTKGGICIFNKKKWKFQTRVTKGDYYSAIGGNGDSKASSDDILDVIKNLYDKEGPVVIDFMEDDYISITTKGTVLNDDIEYKLEEIKEIIRKNLIKD